MFEPVESNVRFPELEARVGQFWKTARIYQKSLEQRAGCERFVFYEGPPTANGMPHPGHCLTRAIKDLFPRYQTMRGKLCERKAGWDTHGLPVEVEVCKELGIHAKEEIEAYGIEPFIQKCQQSVWRYMQEWERLTERLGFWVDLRDAYVTYHQTYIESVWWSLKELFDRGLLYQGHKIVWWWAQGGTALSAGEVGQGYREVADPSVYVKFPIVMDERAKALDLSENTSLLVWTTTPWTLPSNQFAAVHPELEYVLMSEHEKIDAKHSETSGSQSATAAGSRLIVAAALVETLAHKKASAEFKLEKRFLGRELIALRYRPPFSNFYDNPLKWGLYSGEVPSEGMDSQIKKDMDQFMRNRQSEFLLTWRIVEADFVTTDTGTGVVHIAPAFGEDDYSILQEYQGIDVTEGSNHHYTAELLCPVAPDGKFTAEGPDYCRGRWVKDCDRDIIRDLKQRGLLFHQEQYLHEYPFCWRAEEDPLIQYPRESWFIRTSNYKEQMLENNSHIHWLPEHIKDGRFGNFLATNVDWALSRERYWGTPLPIWVCQQTEKMEAIASYDELLAKPGLQGLDVWEAARSANPELAEDLKVHKPYIDALTYDSPFAAGARMRRVSEVIDCWYDSGAMPFAQWGYPHHHQDKFAAQFPADFISEAIDQTRGWFYSQLAISTLLFGQHDEAVEKKPYPHDFKNCIVLGLMLGEDGQKMSKSKRNYREPNEIFDRYGADALRWYFFANQPPWTSIRYSERAIKESIPEFLLRLWNVYSFFVIYANIDGFQPIAAFDRRPSESLAAADLSENAELPPSAPELGELDRWILSELHRTVQFVTERMDAYDNFAACGRITEFVDGLSNWYVRSSRDRFWAGDKRSPDKLAAYETLYECLVTTAKLIAPFVPFLAEALWQNLKKPLASPPESVHLCDYPVADETAVDRPLSERMALVREIASLGRAARMNAKLKVRQPLDKVEVILSEACRAQHAWLAEHAALIASELNVKQVEFSARADQYITYTILPDLKKLGPKLGKQLPAVKQALAGADGGLLLAELEAHGQVTLPLAAGPVVLDKDDLQIRLAAKEGWAAAQGQECVVVLATELSPVLLREGHARELVHAIQTRRKELALEFTDRIRIGLDTDDKPLKQAVEQFRTYIMAETLAAEFEFKPIAAVEAVELKISDLPARLFVTKA
ncbi:MAG TPA: isoleucine--tRNA ligase [Pirellulales bacterium]|jgi:isoleucyl-tRNA synthetase|nr:isoleucine--tRNA ligase [Pirellulales bacterium]